MGPKRRNNRAMSKGAISTWLFRSCSHDDVRVVRENEMLNEIVQVLYVSA